MRNAREIMMKIGRIVNIVFIALGALLMVLGIVGIVLGALSDGDTQIALASSGGDLLGNGIWMLIMNIVSIILIPKANAIVFNGQDNVIKGSVFIIIIGVVAWNPFYILAGIFGIIVKDEINKESQEKKDAEPAEVVEDEPFEEAEVVTEDGEEVVAEETKDEE